ncbi:MAG: 50S ribosomal protein L10 [Thermotoga sp. 4484_232]|nr:50S ribosomal protein L10 [Thermotogaceae bacterium]OQX59058.1 MAG: 50S ribosomal protein L10 [Thermotoga sp. 4484_232]RKX55315.1 MAG: 50S ribosomal protein L10 [Thermotoga sp.]HDG61459.1 50S ribosomal protein L10 [Thermotoga sp.]
MLTREEKKRIVEEMTEILKNSSLILFTDFTGLSVEQISELRARIREKYGKEARYRVVKNTLLGFALERAGFDPQDYKEFLFGPTAVLYVLKGDPVEAVKIIYSFYKEKKLEKFKFKGGFLERKRFSAEEVENIAKLPSKEELYAMIVGRLKGPINGLVFVLSGILRNLLYVLNAIKDKKQ